MTLIITRIVDPTHPLMKLAADYHNAHQEIEESIPACDFHEREWCSKQKAEWIALAVHGCGAFRHYLICTPCRDLFLYTEESFECRACGDVVTPVRHLFNRFTPI